MHKLETVSHLRKENQTLLHELHTARAKLEEAQVRADLATKAALEAWAFARVALKTGRGDRARQT